MIEVAYFLYFLSADIDWTNCAIIYWIQPDNQAELPLYLIYNYIKFDSLNNISSLNHSFYIVQGLQTSLSPINVGLICNTK